MAAMKIKIQPSLKRGDQNVFKVRYPENKNAASPLGESRIHCVAISKVRQITGEANELYCRVTLRRLI